MDNSDQNLLGGVAAPYGDDTPLDFARIVEENSDAIALYDSDWRILYINAAAEKSIDRLRKDLLGRRVPDVWPETFASSRFESIRQSMIDRKEIVTQHHSTRDPSVWREVHCAPLKRADGSDSGGLVLQWRDITATRNLEAARREYEFKAQSAVRALDAVMDAFITIDADFRIVYANSAAATINRKPVNEFLGKNIWEEWPEITGTRLDQLFRRSMSLRTSESTVEHYFERNVHDVWLDISLYPDQSSGGLHVVYRDVTQRMERQRRERFLAGLADRARTLTDPDAVIADLVWSVGEFLDVSRCTFADIDLENDTCIIHPDYCANGVQSMAGAVKISDFGSYLSNEFEAGRPVVVNDVRNDSVRVPSDTLATYEKSGIIAHVTVPLLHTNKLVSTIAVHSSTPRNWTNDEIDLLKIIVERTWLTVEVTRQHRALSNELLQRREIARQQAQFSTLVQNSTDFIGIASLNGNKMFVNDAGRSLVGLPPVGTPGFDISSLNTLDFFFPEDADYILNEFLPQVFRDGSASQELRFRHFVTREPIWVDFAAFVIHDPETNETTSLMTITRDISERKRQDEEREHLRQRERKIAEQLQAALLPSKIDLVPGMALRGYYRAALQEAGVGGDFSDCYPCSNGSCTCLVVADVSGKGLKAASQVAAIRNMLRYAMYESNSISAAVTHLNRILVEQEHIEGFATLFVGAYNAETHQFTYVNCGQEPGLVKRSGTGTIELMQPTGQVLGSYVDGDFEQVTIELNQGDVIALFTDGLTESGPSRTQFLGLEGVADLLKRAESVASFPISDITPALASSAAANIVQTLIDGVEEYAGGSEALRDDIVLLVGIPFS